MSVIASSPSPLANARSVGEDMERTGQASNPNEGRSVYIAGPMAGIENLNAAAFARAAEKLSAEGWTVYDPVEIGELYGTAEEIQGDPNLLAKVVKAELGFVARADAIYLLEGWERSVGAKRELLVALGCGLEVLTEKGKQA